MKNDNFEQLMTDKPDTEDKNPDERSDDGGGIIGRKVLAVIVGFVFILACIYSLGACDSANKKSSSSYSNSLSRSYASSSFSSGRSSGSNYSKGSSSGFSTKETTQAYGTLTSPPTEGTYLTEEMKEQCTWMGEDFSKFDQKTTKYNYRTEDASYTFWVGRGGKILEVSETRYGKPETSAESKKKQKTTTESSDSKKKQKTTVESSEKETPEFDVEDFVHPEDFYDWYKDDFVEYEEAEDYWEEWQ